LAAYGSCLSFLVERVKQYDFSSCKGTLVASVPGRHTGAMHHRFGAMKVKQAIRRLEVTQLSPASSIILQCSSIGSWGTNNKWLKSIFGALDPHGLIPDHEFYFIYPTVENVRNSVEGWNAGNSLPYSHQCHLKHLSYLKQYLCSWHAIESGQKARMPHIKSYVQVNQATKEMDWIWLTSANMSKAAMGEEQKTGYFIRNYELGIFLAPSMFPDRPVFRYCTQKEDESYTQQWCFHPDHFDSENVYHRPLKEEGGVIVISDDETEPRKRQKQERLIMPIRLAYDLPVRKYSDQDECWTFDIPRTEPDLFGQQRL
jgi:tyrosyl-DNA phosphodiesterase-1